MEITSEEKGTDGKSGGEQSGLTQETAKEEGEIINTLLSKRIPMNISDRIKNNKELSELASRFAENVLRPDNFDIISKAEFIEALKAGNVVFKCIDGRSTYLTKEHGKFILHVPGGGCGLFILAVVKMLQNLGIHPSKAKEIITKFVSTLPPEYSSCHSGTHSSGDESTKTCDCGHLKNHALNDLDDTGLEIINTYYQNPEVLPGGHAEDAIILSMGSNYFIIVKEPNDGTYKTGAKAKELDQVFWFDVGLSTVITEHYAADLTNIVNTYADTSFDANQIAAQWMSTFVEQTRSTVDFLGGASKLRKEGKILTIAKSEAGIDIDQRTDPRNKDAA